jgi:hypothetical protein
LRKSKATVAKELETLFKGNPEAAAAAGMRLKGDGSVEMINGSCDE